METKEEFRITRKLTSSCDKQLKDVLKGKNTSKILEEVLSIESFEPEDLKTFDEFFKGDKMNTEETREMFLEAFVKISGVESLINDEIRQLSLKHESSVENSDLNRENPLIFSNKHFKASYNKEEQNEASLNQIPNLSKLRILFENSTTPFQNFRIFEFAKKIPIKNDSKMSILAYLICINKEEFYSGEFEIFYLIDYLVKDKNVGFQLKLKKKHESQSNQNTNLTEGNNVSTPKVECNNENVAQRNSHFVRKKDNISSMDLIGSSSKDFPSFIDNEFTNFNMKKINNEPQEGLEGKSELAKCIYKKASSKKKDYLYDIKDFCKSKHIHQNHTTSFTTEEEVKKEEQPKANNEIDNKQPKGSNEIDNKQPKVSNETENSKKKLSLNNNLINSSFALIKKKEIKPNKISQIKVREGEIPTIRGEILSKWAKNCTKNFKEGSTVTFEIENFFHREILLLNDFNSLIEIIRSKKSHEILYLRLKFILNFLSEKKSKKNLNLCKINSTIQTSNDMNSREASAATSNNNQPTSVFNISKDSYKEYLRWFKQTVKNVFAYSSNLPFAADLSLKEHISADTKMLTSLIIDSFQDNSPYTECILLDLKSEYITSQLIYKTNTCIPCFYSICKTVNPIYIECLNICIDKLELMSDNKLMNVVKSSLFRVKSFEGFKAIFMRLKDKKGALPLKNLLSKVKDNRSSNALKAQPISWKDELCRRINFIVDFLKDKSMLLPFAKEALTTKNVNQSVALIFKIRSFALFKTGFQYLFGKYDELLSSINRELSKKEFSVFYYKVVNFLIKNGYLEHLDFFDTTPYSEAIKRKLLKNGKVRRQLQSQCKDGNNEFSNIVVRDGLYFNNSLLKIQNPYKKFILVVEFIVYKESLEDMKLLKLGKDITLEIEGGDIKIKHNGLSRLLASINQIFNQNSNECNDHSECKQETTYKSLETNSLSIKSNEANQEMNNDNLNNKEMNNNSQCCSNSCDDIKETVTSDIKDLNNNTVNSQQNKTGIIKGATNQQTNSEKNFTTCINSNKTAQLPSQTTQLLSALANLDISNVFSPISLKFNVINTGRFLSIELAGFNNINILNYEISSISIDEEFTGVLNSLLFSETTEMIPDLPVIVEQEKSLFRNVMAYFNENIKPIDKLLDYKGRKGVFVDRKGVFNLGKNFGKEFVVKKNILEV